MNGQLCTLKDGIRSGPLPILMPDKLAYVRYGRLKLEACSLAEKLMLKGA